MKKDHYAPGEPCWIDCGTDIAKAATFYGGLFGWSFLDLGDEAGGYNMAQLDGSTVAGLGPQQNPGPPFWTVYFCTHDAEKTADKVRAGGGGVLVEPMDVMGEGRMAIFTDPAGAAFAVWQPMNTPGLGEVDAPGTLCWSELITSDLDAAKKFYGEVFGWGAKDGDDNSMEYTEFQLGVTSVAGMMPRPDMMPAEMPNYWGLYFAVDDTDATIARVAELGGSTIAGPMDVPVGRFATCVDSAGAIFCVIDMAAG